jgi:hypothetical protein
LVLLITTALEILTFEGINKENKVIIKKRPMITTKRPFINRMLLIYSHLKTLTATA